MTQNKTETAQHQARRQNMADLAAKDGSQETVVNLLALCVNLLLLPMVSSTPHLPFLLFLVLAALHIYSNYKAVSCLVMSTLNLARLNMVLDKVKESGMPGSVLETNQSEAVMWPAGAGAVQVELGISVQGLHREEVDRLEQVVDKEEPYLLVKRDNSAKLVITSLATPRDVYRGYVEGYLGGEHDAGAVVRRLEDVGWDLSTLALSTHGYVLQVEQ